MQEKDLQNLVNIRQDLNDEEKLALLEKLRKAAEQLANTEKGTTA